jgi:diguanylate cyclase (GGDEF)-like protein
MEENLQELQFHNRHIDSGLGLCVTMPIAALEASTPIGQILKQSFLLMKDANKDKPIMNDRTIELFDLELQSIGSINKIADVKNVLWNEIVQACIQAKAAQIANVTVPHEANGDIHTICILPVFTTEGNLAAVLGLFFLREEPEFEQLLFAQRCSLSFENYIQIHLSAENVRRDEEAYERTLKLFDATKKIHSKIVTDTVLEEVIENMQGMYPQSQVSLLLSQDKQISNLAIKPLTFQNMDDDICAIAFMESQMVVKHQNDNACIAAPLHGKQGVYGVLYFEAPQNTINDDDFKLIATYAETAGSAFENAKLYEQSNLLINELRLINEITKRLNQSLSLNEIFDFVSNELLDIFGAEYFCILQSDSNRENLIVKVSNLPAIFHEQLSIDHGFSGVVFETKESVIISDYDSNPKVKSRLMEMTHSRSLIASPITMKGEVVGVIMVAHRKPNFFSYDNFKLLQVLSVHFGLAIANASLHSELQRMVITDNLTNLYVRHYLDEQVNTMQKKDFCGSLILVDIDYFKKVNDTFGHQVGDQILIQVSNIIKKSVRDHDIPARWGGEELAVYLPQISKDQALRIAERIRLTVMKETNPNVTVSCGVTDWKWEDERISVETLFYKADMAMYQAKNDGRNQIKVG